MSLANTCSFSSGISNLDISKKAVHIIVTHIEARDHLYKVLFICRCLTVYTQTKFKKFNVSEIIKGGSLGHGTAVPGHYDINLVIYSRGGQYIQMMRNI